MISFSTIRGVTLQKGARNKTAPHRNKTTAKNRETIHRMPPQTNDGARVLPPISTTSRVHLDPTLSDPDHQESRAAVPPEREVQTEPLSSVPLGTRTPVILSFIRNKLAGSYLVFSSRSLVYGVHLFSDHWFLNNHFTTHYGSASPCKNNRRGPFYEFSATY